ncbi:MAG: hypothetical protein JO168_20770 [Solirubrobacterales bacterium]|nr:hypothetical protein [Solirubrobacterales bacterium]MBV9715642.1 hypothetical protein [Solirubrobacterales bacterium]
MTMQTGQRGAVASPPAAASGQRRRAAQRSAAWFGGGTTGNEQLTATAGAILLVLLPLLGLTIVLIGQLMSEHLFIGLLLLGPVGLKMASTGYRFARYYTHDPVYRHKGPPELVLRLIAPIIVLSTVVVFATGILLLFVGPSHRGTPVLIHKVSFIVWLVFTGLHVLGHVPRLGRSLRVARARVEHPGRSPGAAGRALTIAGALLAGVVLAVSLIPQYHVWTAPGAIPHHHHHEGG